MSAPDAPTPRRRWLRRHPVLGSLTGLVLGGFLLLNVLAYRQAHAMITIEPPGTVGRTMPGVATLLLDGLRLDRAVNEHTPAELDLDYETVQLESKDGVALEGWWMPHPNPRATVVLLHGYAASKQDVLPLAAAFHERGCACLAIDFRGAGGSGGNQTSVGYHEANDAAAALAEARRRTPGRPLLAYGVSMGAAAVLRAVYLDLAHPDALVLESPFNRFLDTVRNRFGLLGVPSFPTADLLVFYGGLLTDSDAFHHDPVTYATAVHVPTLILQGERDRRVSVPQAQQVLDALASADKTLHVFPGQRHTRFLRHDPQGWAAVVDPFLARVAPAAP